MDMLSNLLDSWGLNPPSRLRRFVFDVVAFRDELARTHPKQWSFVMNANASILSTKQNMTFTYAISRSDPTRLVQVDISGEFWELDIHCDAPNRDPEVDRKLLENEAWVDTKSIGPTHVRCKACKERVDFFHHNFYFREWQDHRDYCPVIMHMMKCYVLMTLVNQTRNRELIYPPNSRDPLLPAPICRNLLS
ncbi:uncharacterized protein EV420DRAFT_392408 [Desarmillaria tabescens]|uniref:Uncharacterized protein n=1 Tax=Armillaria tabescens TaxID=1929756 RepID=A0AA39N5L5_ARMTA|nr:uncharacterized protein EV420DRAFT_392408 [Desarmillaria tabescens]KAK0458313.1 hypothetical protein EV420DRAFT_392408 [Desarmillaria tabescens]